MFGPVHLLLGAQDIVTTAPQVPAPLQFAASVSMAAVVAVPVAHDRFRQPCPVPKNAQRAVPAPLVGVLFPAHRPLRPHVVGSEAATHAVAGSGSETPAAIGEQVPTKPASLQDSHVPAHAVLQQTPGLPSVR